MITRNENTSCYALKNDESSDGYAENYQERDQMQKMRRSHRKRKRP